MYLFVGFFETEFLSVSSTILELSLQIRLTFNSQKLACLSFPNVGIKGMHHWWKKKAYLGHMQYAPVWGKRGLSKTEEFDIPTLRSHLSSLWMLPPYSPFCLSKQKLSSRVSPDPFSFLLGRGIWEGSA